MPAISQHLYPSSAEMEESLSSSSFTAGSLLPLVTVYNMTIHVFPNQLQVMRYWFRMTHCWNSLPCYHLMAIYNSLFCLFSLVLRCLNHILQALSTEKNRILWPLRGLSSLHKHGQSGHLWTRCGPLTFASWLGYQVRPDLGGSTLPGQSGAGAEHPGLWQGSCWGCLDEGKQLGRRGTLALEWLRYMSVVAAGRT